MGTVWSGRTDGQRASWHTAYPSTSALAVGVTGGLKELALLVRDAIHFAAQSLLTCRENKHTQIPKRYFTIQKDTCAWDQRRKLNREVKSLETQQSRERGIVPDSVVYKNKK